MVWIAVIWLTTPHSDVLLWRRRQTFTFLRSSKHKN